MLRDVHPERCIVYQLLHQSISELHLEVPEGALVLIGTVLLQSK